MCLIIFDWRPDAHAAHAARFTLAANRDEFFSRAAMPLDWWPDAPLVLAGRDLQGGGTWLGLHRDGRFAALTNYRAPGEKQLEGPSRGRLVADFLAGPRMAPLVYLRQLMPCSYYDPNAQTPSDPEPTPGAGLGMTASAMRGFNLLVGNLAEGELAYFSNRANLPPRLLPAGCYGLSNALLDTAWPKVTAKKAALRDILSQRNSSLGSTANAKPESKSAQLETLLQMMRDTREAPDAALPHTGLTLARERALSAAYIVSPDYGTRCTTVLQFSQSGWIDIVERGDSETDGSRRTDGERISRFSFQLEA